MNKFLICKMRTYTRYFYLFVFLLSWCGLVGVYYENIVKTIKNYSGKSLHFTYEYRLEVKYFDQVNYSPSKITTLNFFRKES